jgi:conjugal transfer/entry exclusion protein
MKKSALDIIKQIMVEVENELPTQDNMRKEVQMMGFKIRQITGDMSSLSRLDSNVIESLWKIGKIDEIISSNFDKLDEVDQDRLLDYLHAIETKTEQRLQQSIKTKKTTKTSKKEKILKLEVFKNFEDTLVN